MSGLKKFEESETWRSNLKKFMFIERKPTLKKTKATGGLQRSSLDIAEDLQNLIEARKQQIELEKQETVELLAKQDQKRVEDTMDRLLPHFDDTCYGAPHDFSFKEKVSDESFEALEKMCDKTASDPNSTLFQYLHSDHQEQILADAKKRSTGEGIAVGLEEVDVEEQLPAKFNDCTLLDDIEAPSRIWENTIIAESGLTKTSPVKMIGLLRPSTIMEELDESVNSDISSQVSYQTAPKGYSSDISSNYDTAFESTGTSMRTDASNKLNKQDEINVDHILEMAIERSREVAAENSLLSRPFVSETITKTEIQITKENNISYSKEEISIDLIDLEKTFAPIDNSPHTSMFGKSVVDVVVIDDDDDDNVGGFEDECSDQQKEYRDSEVNEFDGDESVIDVLSDDEVVDDTKVSFGPYHEESDNVLSRQDEDYDSHNGTFEENKENFSRDSLSRDISMRFNDTMEEVEYMIKKGMEYMAAQEIQSKHTAEKCEDNLQAAQQQKIPLIVDHTNITYPLKPQQKTTTQMRVCRTQPSTPVASARAPAQAATSMKKVKPKVLPVNSDYFPQIGVRPFPKFDVFGGKTLKSHPRHKQLAAKLPFSHVVSPVGAYMKKTASTPLMSTSKMHNSNANVMKSSAFRELEYESRLYAPKFDQNSANSPCGSGLPTLPGLTGTPQTLPKKAYISSELKHIVDERTPITIPGGKKIQKYLENAMMPAVLRHDGKMKFPGAPNVANIASQTAPYPLTLEMKTPCGGVSSRDVIGPHVTASSSRRNNASLADLSVMSGDVSMYTIMDAQKF